MGAVQTPPGAEGRLEEMAADAAHARRKLELYRAKVHSSRLTSPARLRELDREATRSAERLKRARARG